MVHSYQTPDKLSYPREEIRIGTCFSDEVGNVWIVTDSDPENYHFRTICVFNNTDKAMVESTTIAKMLYQAMIYLNQWKKL